MSMLQWFLYLAQIALAVAESQGVSGGTIGKIRAGWNFSAGMLDMYEAFASLNGREPTSEEFAALETEYQQLLIEANRLQLGQ